MVTAPPKPRPTPAHARSSRERSLVPVGMATILPRAAKQVRRLEAQLLEQVSNWGYDEIILPTFEYLDVLAPGLEEFADLLAELEGRVQLNLRATYMEDAVLAEVVAADPQVAALRERTRDLPEDESYGERVRLGELVARALEHKREEDTAVLMDAVTPRVAAWVERGGGGGIDHVVDVALLVDTVNLASFEEFLEGLAEAVHERIRLRLVGPVAPYDFVGGAGWA